MRQFHDYKFTEALMLDFLLERLPSLGHEKPNENDRRRSYWNHICLHHWLHDEGPSYVLTH